MAPTDTTARNILKPKSIAQRVRDNESAAASPMAIPSMIDTQRVADNEATITAPTATAAMAESDDVNQTTSNTVENDEYPQGFELIRRVLPALNAQTTAYIELNGKTSLAYSAATLDDLQGVIEMIQFLHAKLTTATLDELIYQSGISYILSWESSEFTIDKLLTIPVRFRAVLKKSNENIERVWGHVENLEVLEEMGCGLKRMKQECLFGFAGHYAVLLRVLEKENEGVKREEERAGFVGPRRAAFTSLFPRKNEVARVFCRQEE